MKGGLVLISVAMLFTPVSWGCPELCQCHASTKMTDCGNRRLTSIPHNLPPETLILHLQDNHIRTLNRTAFMKTPWIKMLDLSNNSMSILPPNAFHELPHLQVLNLTGNNIQYLENKLFSSLPDLRELDLSYNGIVSLPESLGTGPRNLTVLAVKHNQLHKIGRFLLDSLVNLKVFLFTGNPWQCNCQIIGLKLWLESFLYRGGMIDELICSGPENRNGHHLLKIPYEVFAMCPSTTAHAPVSSGHHHSQDHRTTSKFAHHGDHGDGFHSDCEPKPKPRPASLRHAIATVVITGVVCGIVCLMMLAAAVYGCAYAAIMAKYHRELKAVDRLTPGVGKGSSGEKEPLGSSLA